MINRTFSFALTLAMASCDPGEEVFMEDTWAKVSVEKIQIQTICLGIDNHKAENGVFPTSLKELLYLSPDWGQLTIDPWGREYFYEPPTSAYGYLVGTFGKDGKPGGEGDDADITNLTLLN